MNTKPFILGLKYFFAICIFFSTYTSFAQSTTRTMSVYGKQFIGRKMANGDVYTGQGLTVASLCWPLGTRLRITDKRTGKSVVVVVTDRMHPRFKHRRIDLSVRVWNYLTNKAPWGIRPGKIEVIKMRSRAKTPTFRNKRRKG